MNSKQLATVLIKVLGLSIAIDGVHTLVTGLLQLFRIGQMGRFMPPSDPLMLLVSNAIVSLLIGIYLITRTRNIVGFLLRDGDE